ncbi:MAG TPA: NUDIX hydrolase [Actinomycetota bacterium]
MADEPDSEDLAFDGAVFSVVREWWPGLSHPYDVARHVGAAAVLPVTPDREVLLVRQFRPPIRRTLVEMPAGLLDVREEDPVTCAARELLEETGYRHRTIEFLGGIYTTAGFSNEYVSLFWALTEREPEQPPEEGIELIRRPLDEMVRAARAGHVRDAKTALALLMVDGRPIR